MARVAFRRFASTARFSWRCFEDHLNLTTFYRRLSIVIRIGRTAVAISHEPPLLNKLPASSIDPLLRALVLAV